MLVTKNNKQTISVKFFLTLLFVMLISFTGCKKEFLPNIGSIPPSDLCLSGFVTPDSIFLVLSRSLPYNYPLDSSNHFLLKDTGIIWIEEDGIFFDTLQPKFKQLANPDGSPTYTYYYTTNKKPSEGKSYHIYAQYPGFQQVEATVYLPHKVSVLHVDTISFYKTEKILIDPSQIFGGSKDTLIHYLHGTVWFRDPAQEKNYYMFPLGSSIRQQPTMNFSIQFDDRDIDGQLVPLYFEVLYETGTELNIDFYTLNEEYFKYNSLWNHAPEISDYESIFYNYNNTIVTYSNTSNRVGMVAGYTKSVTKIFLP